MSSSHKVDKFHKVDGSMIKPISRRVCIMRVKVHKWTNSSHEEIKIHKGTSFLADKVDKSIMKFISPQMDNFETNESKLLSHKVDKFIRAGDEHTHTNKQHTY